MIDYPAYHYVICECKKSRQLEEPLFTNSEVPRPSGPAKQLAWKGFSATLFVLLRLLRSSIVFLGFRQLVVPAGAHLLAFPTPWETDNQITNFFWRFIPIFFSEAGRLSKQELTLAQMQSSRSSAETLVHVISLQ